MPDIIADDNILPIIGHLTLQPLYTDSGKWYVAGNESINGSTGRFLDMAIDNVHTLVRLDLKIIEGLLDTHCSKGKKGKTN